MIFSPVKEGGIASLITQEREATVYHWLESALRGSLITKADCYEIQLHKQVVGYWVVRRVLDEAELLNFVIFKPYQSRGLGQQAISKMCQYLAGSDVKTVFLEVRASNISAIKLYQKSGFSLIRARVNYYATATGTEDALNMQLSL